MLSDAARDVIRFLAESVMPEETDWLSVKKQLLITLSPCDRFGFTRREKKTKLHYPFSELENEIRAYWKSLTGNTLVIPEEKRLLKDDPEAYL